MAHRSSIPTLGIVVVEWWWWSGGGGGGGGGREKGMKKKNNKEEKAQKLIEHATPRPFDLFCVQKNILL